MTEQIDRLLADRRAAREALGRCGSDAPNAMQTALGLAQKAEDALASILARHKPEWVPEYGGGDGRTVCAECRAKYPCRTRLDALRGLSIEIEK